MNFDKSTNLLVCDNLLIKIPPRKSKSIFLAKNQKIKIINTHGTQVVDTWCFNQADIKEFMSMEHNRAVTSSIFPKEGEFLYTNKRQPILYILKAVSYTHLTLPTKACG